MGNVIIIVSIDAEFYLISRHILESAGFQPVLADNSDDTIRLVRDTQPLAVIVDCRSETFVMASEIFQSLKNRPEANTTLTIALVGNGAGKDHLDLLKAGADEMLRRPFAPSKLLQLLGEERDKNLSLIPDQGHETAFRYADLELEMSTHRVRRGGILVRLPTLEFNILRLLIGEPERIFSREELIAGAWPPRVYVEPRTVDVHVGHLRRLLMGKGGSDLVRTVRAAGYSLDSNPRDEE